MPCAQLCKVLGCKACCGLTALVRGIWTGLASTTNIIIGVQIGRADLLRGLRNFQNREKPKHHSINCLKKTKKTNDVPSSRSGMIYFYLDKSGYCFKEKLWETAERLDGVPMSLSKHYDAILSRNWLMETARCLSDRLVGLVVKVSASRAEDPGFESRLRRDFFGVKSYQ